MSQEEDWGKWSHLKNETVKLDGENIPAFTDIIDLSDYSLEDKIDILEVCYGEEHINQLIEMTSSHTENARQELGRVQALVLQRDNTWDMLGDCGCLGANCRGAWQWIQKATDLSWRGAHGGDLWQEPCSHATSMLFHPETGETYPKPQWGMNPEYILRFMEKRWGDTQGQDLDNFLGANLAISEGRGNDWKVD